MSSTAADRAPFPGLGDYAATTKELGDYTATRKEIVRARRVAGRGGRRLDPDDERAGPAELVEHVLSTRCRCLGGGGWLMVQPSHVRSLSYGSDP